ncbi:Alpha/Beta hydrolase protein [Dactylonectria macrodidyma]|uniref:Alpha/Beta hydrolase protein n=1 Tax=Dactylonectria macrodidyma TaxID=307937 RepID=A0A9P9F6K5_9HYPO|nr:Alpha/Beta hydrolase protein [Dactylonectria macrodidyma]
MIDIENSVYSATSLQIPISLLSYSIASAHHIFSRPFTVAYLPIGRGLSRALVHKAAGIGRGRKLRPLYVDIHGGSFIGGLPEGLSMFDDRIAKETVAVVVSITYRYAPEHVFPAAIDDVDVTIKWLQENAEARWGADPTLMTISGFSAGGNLAIAATQQENCHSPSPTAIKASVTFYAAIDLRLKPGEKPRLASFPKRDPMSVLFPLFDAYASSARATHPDDPRLSPVLAKRETLPERMLLVIPAIDILVAEQTAFAERINNEDLQRAETPRMEVFDDAEGFHGYLEVPNAVVPKKAKDKVFDRALTVLRETYEKHEWTWEG